MIHIAQLMLRHFPLWNVKKHTQIDAYEFCDRRGIIILETENIDDLGKYKTRRGVPFILIHRFISDRYKTWVLFHEITHFIAHPLVDRNFSDEVTQRKFEKEANFGAAILMMPQPMIRQKTLAEIQEETGCASKLILFRKVICDNEKQ